MFEPQRHNTILQLALHLRERQARHRRCCLCAYQGVDFRTGLLGSAGEGVDAGYGGEAYHEAGASYN